MKILMLGWEFPPRISGGLGTACQGIVRALAARGTELCFVLPRVVGGEEGGGARIRGLSVGARGLALPPEPMASVRERAIASPLRAYATRAGYAALLGDAGGLAAAQAAASSSSPAAFRGGYGPDLASEVERYAGAVLASVEGEEFDLIHAHDWMTFPAGLRLREALDRPLVSHVHACEYDRAPEQPDAHILAVERAAFEGAERVVCVSRYTAEMLASRYGCSQAKLRVVHNGVEPWPGAAYPPTARDLREPIVLFLGRLTAQKGPELFLAAAEQVLRVEPRVKFVISGDGELLPELVERAARAGLARAVHFTGFLERVEVERMLSLADIYVMPSLSEPFGLAPLEAAACGAAVILSSRSGVAEVLKSALRFDPGDVDGLARRILLLLQRPMLRARLARGARREVRCLSWARSAVLLERVYTELAA